MAERRSGGPIIQRIEDNGRSMYVSRNWYAHTLDNKEKIAGAAAVCLSNEGTSNFYDAYTGKKVAAWFSRYINYEG